MRVFITSEKRLPAEFEPHRLPISAERIHHALAFAEFFLGDSQSMTVESALLGTPAFKINTFAGIISVIRQLEEYGLAFGYRPGEEDALVRRLQEVLLDWLCLKLEAVPAIDEIVIVTNKKFITPIEEWKRKSHYRMPIEVWNDGTQSNETRLGAIGDLQFLKKQRSLDAEVLLLASDNIFEADLASFYAFSKENQAVSLALYDIGDPRLAAGKFGVAEVNSKGQVVRLQEKPVEPASSLIATGVYYFPQGSLGLIDAYLNEGNSKDAPGYFIQWLSGRQKVCGYVFKGVWYDIGDLKALEEANKLFTKIE
jgi:glucose-1-phosphate thymidylyltransferase